MIRLRTTSLGLLGLLATLLATPGCARQSGGHDLGWRTLSRGLISGIQTPRRQVIRNEADYLAVWAEHAADLERPALPPRVDFDREMVVLVTMGTRPTGGYFVQVVDAELRGRVLTILVEEREPAGDSIQIQQLTQPFQFIALPAVQGRARFREVRPASRRATEERKARPGEEGRR